MDKNYETTVRNCLIASHIRLIRGQSVIAWDVDSNPGVIRHLHFSSCERRVGHPGYTVGTSKVLPGEGAGLR